VVAVRRFETAPGHQAQVDAGHLGRIDIEAKEHKLWAFTFTLGYSLDQKLGTLLRANA